jgi:hypothetical protein
MDSQEIKNISAAADAEPDPFEECFEDCCACCCCESEEECGVD